MTAPQDVGYEDNESVTNHGNNNIDGIIIPEANMTPEMIDLLDFDLEGLDLGGYDYD